MCTSKQEKYLSYSEKACILKLFQLINFTFDIIIYLYMQSNQTISLSSTRSMQKKDSHQNRHRFLTSSTFCQLLPSSPPFHISLAKPNIYKCSFVPYAISILNNYSEGPSPCAFSFSFKCRCKQRHNHDSINEYL